MEIKKVLVAEDNPVNQIVIEGILDNLKVPFHLVDNGEDAVKERCEKPNDYNCILMDCEMPLMNGYEASRKIREWEDTKGQNRLPICALTAHAMMEQARMCEEAGMDAHLTKPIMIPDLEAYLDTI